MVELKDLISMYLNQSRSGECCSSPSGRQFLQFFFSQAELIITVNFQHNSQYFVFYLCFSINTGIEQGVLWQASNMLKSFHLLRINWISAPSFNNVLNIISPKPFYHLCE